MNAAGTAIGRRVVFVYAGMAALLVVVCVIAFRAGSDETPLRSIGGTLAVDEAGCLGPAGATLTLEQSGSFVTLAGVGDTAGKLRYEDGRLTGDLTCADGRDSTIDAAVTVKAVPGAQADAQPENHVSLAGEAGDAPFTAATVPAEAAEAATAEHRSGEETFGRLMVAIAAVLLAARLVGAGVRRIGQPQVMGEVLAGILLGPTLLGAIAPEVKDYLFAPDIVPLITAAASIGLAFYMFLVGLELDPRVLRGRIMQAAVVSNASVVVPMVLGIAVAVPLFTVLAEDTDFIPFALFMGVAMSITAFPVLARILIERRMLKRPVGAMALAAAAVDDVTAWCLLALATATAGGEGLGAVAQVVGLAVVFCLGMALVARRLVGRVSTAYDEAGRIPVGWIATIFVGVLLAAYVSQTIGIAAIFGAFVMGMIMPRRADLTADVTRRVEPFVVTVLLPLFFAVTGLKTEFGLLDQPELWLIALLLLAIAIVGKWSGAMLAARFVGMRWREANALGALMNTRGLTELIVLNIGLELGVITPAIFTMLVMMALVTTFMAAPALRLIDPRRELSSPVEEELAEAPKATELEQPVPERAILVAPLEVRNLDRLLAIAVRLARSTPPREIVIAGLVRPMRTATGVMGDERQLEGASADVMRRRTELISQGVATRAVAFTSADAGKDLVRLASEEEVDVLLVDGRRPLLGEGVPRGAVGTALEHAPCDVAVLVERGDEPPEIDAEHPVIVPFGGADHDWAALELGAWVAATSGAPLVLLGSAGDSTDGRDASRLLANASLVVQQLIGVPAEPLLAPPGTDAILHAAEGAGLLLIGLSERWRQEGLGPVRSAIARAAPAPTLFVRRGLRPGALASPENLTRFTWSAGSAGAPR